MLVSTAAKDLVAHYARERSTVPMNSILTCLGIKAKAMHLSFGVEYEGVYKGDDYPRSVGDQLNMGVDALNAGGLNCANLPTCYMSGGYPDHENSWYVTFDSTIKLHEDYGEDKEVPYPKRLGFEVITPIFYELDSFSTEISTSLACLVRAELDWFVNYSTGVHVHVGKGGPGIQYTTEELKRLAWLAVRFESW